MKAIDDNGQLSNYTPESLDAETQGLVPILQRHDPARRTLHEERVAECAAMWADVHNTLLNPAFLSEALNPSPEGFTVLRKRYPHLFFETMTTSDFNALTADVLDRQLIANFEAASTVYQNYCRVSQLRDFRQVSRRKIDGGEDQARATAELEGWKAASAKVETDATYTPSKYVNGDAWSWESAVNDDLGIFRDLPQRLANGHVAAIERVATALFVDSSGPHASLYTAGNNNIVASNPVLSVSGLNDALATLRTQTNSDGEPIIFNGTLKLVVPAALEGTATNIKNQLVVDLTGDGGDSTATVRTNNWIAGRFDVVVNPWIDLIATTNGDTSWFVFANPAQNRPALEMGFLRGFQTPQMFQKASNTLRTGGGIDQMLGDFETMSTMIKAITVFGGTTIEPKTTVASNGTGS